MENTESVERRCDLPYGVEYAKSARAACKGCKNNIGQDSLRISVREPSRFFDGMQDNWFHFHCFWPKLKPSRDVINERSIRGIEGLKWDDQERIRRKIAEFASGSSRSDGDNSNTYSNLKVEYAKTSRGKCFSCKQYFEKEQLKIGRKSSWFHFTCIFGEQSFKGNVSDILGFSFLTTHDQNMLAQNLPVELSNQVERDALGGHGLNRSNTNNIEVITLDISTEDIEHEKKTCKRSSNGENLKEEEVEIAFKKTKLDSKSLEEKNKEKLKKQAELMWELRTGFQNNMKKKQMIELLEKNDQQPPSEESKILDLLVDCALFGKPAPCCKCPHGQIVFSTSNKTYVCLGYMSEYTKCMYQDKNPLRSPFAIPRDMIEAIDWLKTIKVNLLTTRVYNVDDDEKIVEPSDSFKYLGSRIFKSVAEEYDGDGVKSTGISSGKSRQIIKNGTVVDQECEYAEVSHVHRGADGTLYSAMLGSTDMAQNRNSYYKMQLLAHDTKRLFYLFRSWGRVGTNVGGILTNQFKLEKKAIEAFENQFFEKTGNKWENRKYFRKKAGLMGMVETDYSEFENVGTEVVTPGSKSKLHRAIKEIIMMIFDVENMKSAMQGFELDLDRMPLGKLSKKQIMSAYKVLTKLQTILADEKPDPDKVLDASNSFYTLIPHNSGMKPPELLNNSKILKEKTAMLDSLLEIQFAYEVLQEDKNSISVDGRDPVDVHYEKLGCDMQYIEPTSSEYEYIMLYMKNTHGATHNMFKLDVVDVIRLHRKGESEKFRGNLGNRHLLWHGSGNSNYAGILSQGLRIAPPEAPVTGYMFGKGLYFADMVSKSANYCRIQRFDTDGLLMLCDVALGKIQEEKHATMRNNLKKGFSSVKGVGMTIPDPNQTIKSEDGYFIPLGTPITVSDGGKHGVDYSLLYNEYIVYDVDQVNLRYLVRVKFRRG